jgi:hypothetical protein
VAWHAAGAARIRPNWLGTANYHLACFYSVSMGARLLDLPRRPVPERRVWRAPELGEDLERERPIGRALEAFTYVSALFQDAGTHAREAFDDYETGASERSRKARREAANALMEQLIESGKRLPARSGRERRRLIQRRLRLERQFFGTRLIAHARVDRLRKLRADVSRFWPTTPDRPPAQALQLRLEQALDQLLQGCEQLLHPAMDARVPAPAVEEVHAHAEALRELLTLARTSLRTYDTKHRATRTALLGRLESIRIQLDALMREPLARLHALTLLTLKLKALEDAVEHLQALCRHAHSVQALGQRACEHLSQSIRDPDGPFTTSTKKWLLGYPDLEPLQAQDSFKAWQWVTLRQGRPSGAAHP